MQIRIVSLLALSAGLLLPVVARAQQPEPSVSGPVFHATANLVLVDVVVRNHGNPVQGLDCQRFHAYENGNEQKISTCDEHTLPAIADDRAIKARIAQWPDGIHTNADPYPAPSAINVLLLDYTNTTDTGNQLVMRQQALALIRSLRPGTRVAIFALTNRLQMLMGFTSDAKADIEKILGPNATELPGISLLAQTFSASGVYEPSLANTITETGGELLDTEQMAEAEEKKFYRDDRVQISINALKQLAAFLSPLEGHKNIVWIGSGFPMLIPPDGSAAVNVNVFGNQADYTALVNNLARTLSALRVSVYPVDIGGIDVPKTADLAKSALQQSKNFASGGPIGTAPDEHLLNIESMKWIAEQTGGKPYYNTNDIAGAAARAIDDGARYYTIGYSPSDHRFDGGYRKIKVHIDDANYQISYRRGYNADPPVPLNAKTSSGIVLPRAALEHGAPQVTDILLDAAALPANDLNLQQVGLKQDAQKPTAGNTHKSVIGKQYVVAIDVSTRRLSYRTAADGKQTAQIVLAIQPYDHDGRPRRLTTERYVLTRVPELTASNKPQIFRAHLAINLPAGRSYLRIAALEPASSKVGSLEFPIEVKN